MTSRNQNNQPAVAAAKEKIRQWAKELGDVQTDTGKLKFKQQLHQFLADADKETKKAFFLALKEYAREIRLEVEQLKIAA